MTAVQAPLALEAIGVTKRFGSITANDDVDLQVEAGTVHALLGENGAGKSTLVNILFGLYHADEGEIRVAGKPVRMDSPRDAIAHRIGMVHQHFQLVPVLTVAENVVLGQEPTRGLGVLDLDAAAAEVTRLAERYGLDVDPRAVLEDLPVGTQQRVEILRSLYRQADVLILDEPTAVLTPQETDQLLGVLRGLATEGVAVVFITHKLREVLAIADRVTVMRHGRVVGSTDPAETDEAGLAEMMVGRSVVLRVPKSAARRVIATSTRAPACANLLAKSAALKAAMLPLTPRTIRLPCSMAILGLCPISVGKPRTGHRLLVHLVHHS